MVAGAQEAECAAREIRGKIIGGRQLYAKVMESVEWEHQEVVIAELADELKIGIISMSRSTAYYL